MTEREKRKGACDVLEEIEKLAKARDDRGKSSDSRS